MDEIEGLKEELAQTKLAYQMAAQISQFKTGFLARTAHELRSPLSSLLGLHQLILSDLCESPEEEKEFLAQAYHAAQKLLRIIDEIVTISKLEYGSIALQLHPVSLEKILSDLEHFIKLQANNRNLKLAIIPPSLELYAIADAERLLQALVMLVDTAISKMELGKIRVSASASEDFNLVQIEIDVDCPNVIWQEARDLLEQVPEITLESVKSFSKSLEMSPGMKFDLAQTLLTEMGGHLQILEAFPETETNPFTRLQCSLPLIPAEVVAQSFAEDS